MKNLCDEIEESLKRSKLLIEQEARERMYFYPQPRGGGGVGGDKDNNSTTGSINALRLKKYWNLFPKKKNKKFTDTINTPPSESKWSSTKNRYGTVSGSMTFEGDFQPKVRTPSKARGTMISPWENYSSVPEVVFEERSRSSKKMCTNNGCTCSPTTPKKTYGGSVRVTHFPTTCSCSPRGKSRFGTARPVMTSINRKSILSNDTNPFVVETSSDEVDSDTAYGSMYDSSPVSTRIGKFVKNDSKAKTSSGSSLYGTLRSRKSILECDVNPYELVQSKDHEDDDLNIDDLEIDDEVQQKKKKKSKFSIYSKVDKGTLRIGGRAMAFNLQKERKMPQASNAPPRRSLSVPDIRVVSDKSVINFEPDPDYADTKQTKVPKLTKLYNSMAPKIPSVSSVVNRKSRTPSPTRKASSPYQSNGVIYGITPLRRPKAPPPPPPPPPRKFDIADDTPFSNRKTMETINENGGQTDFRSILKKPSYGGSGDHTHKPSQDSCSETSSSAYGSMNSEIKSILKKSVDGQDGSQSGCEKKKQVKFKSASDNSLLVENINDKLDYCDDIDDETEEQNTLLEGSDDFVSVGECVVSASKPKPSNTGVKFELRTRTFQPRTPSANSIVGKTRVVFENNEVAPTKKVAPVKCSIRSWTSAAENDPVIVPKSDVNVSAVNINNNLKIEDSKQTKVEVETDAVDFPEFDPDDRWLSSPTTSLSQTTPSSVTFPKNVEASPTMTQDDNGSHNIMARGREPQQQNSAKIHVSSSSQVSTNTNSEETPAVIEKPVDSIYDTVQSGTITCTYLTEVQVDSKDQDTEEQDAKELHREGLSDDCLGKLPEDSEIDALYDDIAGVSEPIYEELANADVISSSPKSTERKSMFEGASKTEILSILNSAKERVMNESDAPRPKYDLECFDEEASSDRGIDLEEIKQQQRNHPNRLSNLSNLSDSSTTSEETSQADSNEDQQLLELVNHNSHRRRRESAEIERNDSGVGSETSKPSKVRRHSSSSTQDFSSGELNSDDQVCEDCEQAFDTNFNLTDNFFTLVCHKCHKRRVERKEIITEIVETEIKYGNDLKILKEEFYKPMEVAGLLLFDQLQSIFINLDELRKMNKKFVEKLTDALEIANEQGDEDYSTLSIGKLFIDSTPMLHGFETYCVQQSAASMLLNNLEKDKELLRVFLGVSQMENTLLRRMNLHAFLMVPVQRVTKYPLLLNRLYKVTPPHHKDRDALKEAQKKIELHLEHINLQTKGVGTTKIWRKISNISIAHRRTTHVEEVGNIKLRTMALELLQWNREEVHFMKEGRLFYTQPSECVKRNNKSTKFISVHALLVTLGRPDTHFGNCKATLLLVKEKGNRLALIREQLPLKDCVISTDLESSETFEVQLVLSKDYFICKANSKQETEVWAEELKKHAKDQGRWRQRRNALANIMISGMNRH